MVQMAEIRDAASNLSISERAELAVYLLSSLDDTHYWLEDEEVARRRAEMDSGEVKGVSREEFRQLCGR